LVDGEDDCGVALRSLAHEALEAVPSISGQDGLFRIRALVAANRASLAPRYDLPRFVEVGGEILRAARRRRW
jgi:hypothetical protein